MARIQAGDVVVLVPAEHEGKDVIQYTVNGEAREPLHHASITTSNGEKFYIASLYDYWAASRRVKAQVCDQVQIVCTIRSLKPGDQFTVESVSYQPA